MSRLSLTTSSAQVLCNCSRSESREIRAEGTFLTPVTANGRPVKQWFPERVSQEEKDEFTGWKYMDVWQV